MLEQLHTGQTSWPPLSLREEMNIDVSPEGLHVSWRWPDYASKPVWKTSITNTGVGSSAV